MKLVLNTASLVFCRTVSESDSFFALGGDSIVAVELALNLEEQLERPIEPDLVISSATFGDLIASLDACSPHQRERGGLTR